jgi:hypothetical protein
LWTDCVTCKRNLSLGGFTFYDDAQEAERRATLAARADAHLIEAHSQRSLFDGCGCR